VKKIRELAKKLGMVDPESANVGVVIGFIVTAIVLAIGVVKVLISKLGFISANPVPGPERNPRNCQQLDMVYDPVKPGNYHTERVFSPFHRPHRKVVLTQIKRLLALEFVFATRTGGRWNFGSAVYARWKQEPVICSTNLSICNVI
jgi:hypothetical protein